MGRLPSIGEMRLPSDGLPGGRLTDAARRPHPRAQASEYNAITPAAMEKAGDIGEELESKLRHPRLKSVRHAV